MILNAILAVVLFCRYSFSEDVKQNNNENACPEFQEIKPEMVVNGSSITEFSFPKNGTNATFPENRKCSWMIHIPIDHFAILYINATVTSGGRITVVQTPNHTETFQDAHVEVALLFVPPSFDLFWLSGTSSDGKLEFNIQWQEYDKDMSFKNRSVTKAGHSEVLDHEDTYNPIAIRAETNVSMMCIPGSRPEEVAYLRTIVVFDGPDLHSPFLGSLYSIRDGTTPFKSSNGSLTVYSLVPIASHHHVVVQDVSMFENMSHIIGMSVHGSNVTNVSLNATVGKSVVVTQTDNTMIDEYLATVDVEKDAELQVYFEGLSETQRIATYTNRNNRTHLPQKLQGRVRFYVLTSGYATIGLTRDKWKANWETPFVGRRGFFTSKYWKHDTSEDGLQQDSFHFIGNEEKNATEFSFSYRIVEEDVSGDSSLHVVVSDNVKRIHYFDHRSSDEPSDGDKWISHRGHSISLVYSSYIDRSNGFLAEFAIDSSSCPSFLILCSLIFVFYLH